jgi:hypothetical protein
MALVTFTHFPAYLEGSSQGCLEIDDHKILHQISNKGIKVQRFIF